jgi:hypothetical protein
MRSKSRAKRPNTEPQPSHWGLYQHYRSKCEEIALSISCPPVLDDKLLAKSLREPLTDQASDDVDAAAGWNADDNAHRPRWIGLRPSKARDSRERGSGRSHMQKLPAGKFHIEPPSRFTSLDHLVGEREQLVGHLETERLRGLEIDD